MPKVCTVLAEMWCLFRKTNFVLTKLENLGYCPDESVLQKYWELCEKQLYISGATILSFSVVLKYDILVIISSYVCRMRNTYKDHGIILVSLEVRMTNALPNIHIQMRQKMKMKMLTKIMLRHTGMQSLLLLPSWLLLMQFPR